MDYTSLADQLLQKTHKLRKEPHQRRIDQTMHGAAFVVIFLAQHGRSVLPSEISSAMDISSARIAAALNSLEKKGLITRQIDVSDRRRILVDLTPEGRAMAEHYRLQALREAARMLEALGEHDAQEFVRIIGKLADNVPCLMRHE